MVKDVKLDLDGESEPKKRPRPPQPEVIHVRWSSVLGKYVMCLDTDHEAVPYRLMK